MPVTEVPADSVPATEVPVTEEKPGDSRPHREIFDSVAWRLLKEMHLHLEDAGLLMECINTLQKLRDNFNGQHINRWCLFGGCGISSKLAAVYSEFLFEEFGLDVRYDTKVFAELKESKRAFLKTEHPTTEFLVSDCTSLVSSAAPNELSDYRFPLILPGGDYMDGGVSCTSRTPLSSKMNGNLNFVQQCREETGLGF